MDIDIDDLIINNMGLVIKIVNSFRPRNDTERDDLIDAGRIGLWKAIKKYKKSSGQLSTFSWRPITWAILKEIKNNTRKHKGKVSLENRDIEQKNSQEPLWEYLSRGLSKNEKKIIELRASGFKLKEISEILNLPQNKVKSMFYNILKKIKDDNE